MVASGSNLFMSSGNDSMGWTHRGSNGSMPEYREAVDRRAAGRDEVCLVEPLGDRPAVGNLDVVDAVHLRALEVTAAVDQDGLGLAREMKGDAVVDRLKAHHPILHGLGKRSLRLGEE
eukprot:scaffold70431_cov39-Prasinocladus_malaysianus.AAC.1